MILIVRLRVFLTFIRKTNTNKNEVRVVTVSKDKNVVLWGRTNKNTAQKGTGKIFAAQITQWSIAHTQTHTHRE